MFTYNIINIKGDLVATSESNDVDFRYNAYGIKLSDNSTNNPIGYRNYYYDSETGLYYLKARYYDPATGQFTQEDTVQDDNLQYNLYGYCSGNPVLYIDPSGHTLRVYGKKAIRKKILNLIVKLTGLKTWNIKTTMISKKQDSVNDFDTITRNSKLTGREANDIYGKSYRLVREIINHAAIVSIKETNGYNSCNAQHKDLVNIGTNSTVNINLKKRNSTYVQEKNSNKTLISKMPYEIVLAHELIHALRNAKGDTIKSTSASDIKEYKFYTPKGIEKTSYALDEELIVTGIGGYYSKYEYNENKIRKEHGYRQRISYLGF